MEEGSIQTSLGTSPKCRLWLDAKHPRYAKQTGSPECKSVEKKWVPRNEWKTEKGKNREWGSALAQEARAQTSVPEPPSRPGPSPGQRAAGAPSCDLGVSPKGTTQEAQAPKGPTERGLASAIMDGLNPPAGNKLTKGQNGVVSDQAEGGTSSFAVDPNSSSSVHYIKKAQAHKNGMFCPTQEMWDEIVKGESPP